MLRFPYHRVPLSRPAPTLAGGNVRYLPILDVGVEGPQVTQIVPCRVDSGSDDTILPLKVATQIGLDLTGAPRGECKAVGGAVLSYPCAQVRLRLSDGKEACLWDAIVGFLDIPRGQGLIGLTGFLEYFETRLVSESREVHLIPNSTFSGQYFVH